MTFLTVLIIIVFFFVVKKILKKSDKEHKKSDNSSNIIQTENNIKICPRCKSEIIYDNAKYCKWCGYSFVDGIICGIKKTTSEIEDYN
ncbi:MAG: hypothetical protein K6C94_01005, partial [Candidatus Gastranaerophilales bacterium]|nr:hypothetical protein [Candidatus Gastranaerophilales bacterium]